MGGIRDIKKLLGMHPNRDLDDIKRSLEPFYQQATDTFEVWNSVVTAKTIGTT